MKEAISFSGPVAFYAFTRTGAALILKLASAWPPQDSLSGAARLKIFWPERLKSAWTAKDWPFGAGPEAAVTGFRRFADVLADNFAAYAGHVIVGAAGIAVRALAPLIGKKTSDPAVVVMSQDGRFAISLLSGHLGGANQLARLLAGLSGGEAVITTATDLAGQPAVETLARERGLTIEDYQPLAAISRTLVEGGRVTVYDPGAFFAPALSSWPGSFKITADETEALLAGSHLIWVDHFLKPLPEGTLLIRPKSVAVAMGCHRGISAEALRAFFYETLARYGLSPLSVGILASVDTRADEPALLALAAELGCPYQTFSKAELARISTPNPSEKVLDHIGVESVCEAAVFLASRAGRLLIPKRKGGTATLAAAAINYT